MVLSYQACILRGHERSQGPSSSCDSCSLRCSYQLPLKCRLDFGKSAISSQDVHPTRNHFCPQTKKNRASGKFLSGSGESALNTVFFGCMTWIEEQQQNHQTSRVTNPKFTRKTYPENIPISVLTNKSWWLGDFGPWKNTTKAPKFHLEILHWSPARWQGYDEHRSCQTRVVMPGSPRELRSWSSKWGKDLVPYTPEI